MVTPKVADRPIGPKVGRTAPAELPQKVVVLHGRFVTVKRLRLDHADDLFDAICPPEYSYLWDYMFDGPFGNRKDFHDHVALKMQSTDPFFYAVLDNATKKAIGIVTLMRVDAANRVIEVGNIMFSPLLQRSSGATECMYLMACAAFEDLGYRRYEWKCDDLNAPSKRAAERLGFTFEGVFRQHMIIKGRNRDSAWFAMLDTEWPTIKRAFQAWLDPGNFDAEGQQRAGLAALRGSMTSMSSS